MNRQEDFIEAGIEYRIKHGTPNAIGGGALAEVVREMNRAKPFEAGAEYGYQYAINKACNFIRLHIGVDMPVRLTPDGQPLAEDFINKAEARANAAQNVVEQFKQFMEE